MTKNVGSTSKKYNNESWTRYSADRMALISPDDFYARTCSLSNNIITTNNKHYRGRCEIHVSAATFTRLDIKIRDKIYTARELFNVK